MKAPAFYAVFAEVDTGGGPVMVWDNDAAFGTPRGGRGVCLGAACGQRQARAGLPL